MTEFKVDWDDWAERTRSYFDKTILTRGWNYFLDGAVRKMARADGRFIRASVSGSTTYRVMLDLHTFTRSTCSCPYGSYCKHMAAVLFEAAEQDGYEAKNLRNGVRGLLTTAPLIELTPKRVIAPPKPTGSCGDWLAYFEQKYGNSKIYHVFSVEELYIRAWGELNKRADNWEPTIRGIYDIQVGLYLMRQCEDLIASVAHTYDYFYQVDYYISRIMKHNQHQLVISLQAIDVDKAQQGYFGHLKELMSYIAANTDKGTGKLHSYWLEIYKLLWTGLLREPSLVKDETMRLRQVQADSRVDRDALYAAVIRLVHFDMMNGEDANAWERVREHDIEMDFEDWSGYMQQFANEGQWGRLHQWLRWLRYDFRGVSSDYLDLWHETAARIDIQKEYRDVMVAHLPGSYRHYTKHLLANEEFETWVDLCLVLNISPLQLESSELRLVEKADIRLLLPLYHYAAEASIRGRNRLDYKQAVKLLKKLATAYKKLKQTPRFEAYIGQLSKQYARYRAFQEELRKGKLIL